MVDQSAYGESGKVELAPFATTEVEYQAVPKGDTSFRNVAYWERRLNGAHRRYLRAIETLARVRKMGPAVQINIAEKQINQIN